LPRSIINPTAVGNFQLRAGHPPLLSYEKNVTGHPANQNVQIRLMALSDRKISVLARLFGGQGTINVPSWSPDSQKVAFVSYQLLPADEAAIK